MEGEDCTSIPNKALFPHGVYSTFNHTSRPCHETTDDEWRQWTFIFGRMEKPESGIRNRSRKRKRNRNPNPNPNSNPNLRNKAWRRFCLKSVTNNYCSIKSFHPHIVFIYCYYIFYCRIFCVTSFPWSILS